MFKETKYDVMGRWMAVAVPTERIFILYLLSAFVIALGSWIYYRKIEKDRRPEKIDQGLFSYILDKDVFTHRSAVQDYIYFFINAIIYTGIIAQLLISTHFFMTLFHGMFQSGFGVHEEGLIKAGIITIALYTIVYTLLLDFAVYITHMAQHKIPVLWEFHKVHHSAEVLTPITLYRMHPVDLFFTGLVASMLAGLGFAGFYYLTGETPTAYEIMGINIILFLFYLLGYNLRHSHIWISYPQWLSHILISPAQHQIHHSVEVKHWDKNFGLIFSFWDRLFGSLYVPKGYEKITYGISKKEPNPFKSVGAMFLQPFRDAWKIIYPDTKAAKAALVFIVGTALCVFIYGSFYTLDKQFQVQTGPVPSVHIEDLTWTEVHRAITQKGYDTIIIPTGGTEQNGPHVILGKHNYVVKHNAGAIATRLGETLVAPVVAYVPEDVHMEWAGTVTVPEELFRDLLVAAGESYIAHGFKNILFIGDSSGNQDAQEQAATLLNERWKDDEIKAVHVGDYYHANNQRQWLIDQGFGEEEIGGHAGIRDTSEMKFIHPEGVRKYPIQIPELNAGYNGRPDKATYKIGRQMTELKIQAALKQIRDAIGKEERAESAEDAARKLRYIEP